MIPRKVIGKFSIRLVPDQQPDEIEKQASVPTPKLNPNFRLVLCNCALQRVAASVFFP